MKTKYALIHDSVQMVPRVYLGGYDQQLTIGMCFTKASH